MHCAMNHTFYQHQNMHYSIYSVLYYQFASTCFSITAIHPHAITHLHMSKLVFVWTTWVTNFKVKVTSYSPFTLKWLWW